MRSALIAPSGASDFACSFRRCPAPLSQSRPEALSIISQPGIKQTVPSRHSLLATLFTAESACLEMQTDLPNSPSEDRIINYALANLAVELERAS
jgi:hypothetical protein